MKSMHTPVYHYTVNLSQTNALLKYSQTLFSSTHLAHLNLRRPSVFTSLISTYSPISIRRSQATPIQIGQ